MDSFNSAGLHLCKVPKRQHRKVVRRAQRTAFWQTANPPRSTKKNRTKKSTPSKRYSEIVALCFIRACFESEYRLRGSTTKILLNGKGFSKKEKPCKIARIFVGFDTHSVWLFENSLIHPSPQRKTALISADFHGGEGWIRTTEVTDNRFTVCSLWPLGNLSVWSWWSESNQQPTDYKSVALPVELHQRIELLVPRGGLEPPTQGFSVPCSTNWATEAYGISIPFWNLWQWRLSLPQTWWRPGGGSNPWPPAWQAGVLTNCTTGPNNFMFWWAFTDSNRGPIGYEPTALTNWAKGPNHIGEVVLVGVKRFELPTFWTQIRRASQTALHPERFSRRSLRLQQYTINPKSCQWFFW